MVVRPTSARILGIIFLGCNYRFPRGFRTIGGLSYLRVYQGPPCSASTVLGASIQVREDRDFTDHAEDRFETMPLVLEALPLIRAMVRVFAEMLGREARDR